MIAATGPLPEAEIAGKVYQFELTWTAYRDLLKAFGENPHFGDPDVLAGVAAIALRLHHPEVTPQFILDASPPMVPVATAVRAAMVRLWYGENGPPT